MVDLKREYFGHLDTVELNFIFSNNFEKVLKGLKILCENQKYPAIKKELPKILVYCNKFFFDCHFKTNNQGKNIDINFSYLFLYFYNFTFTNYFKL